MNTRACTMSTIRSDYSWECLVDQLTQNEWGIQENFLRLEEVINLRDHIDQLQSVGHLKKAGIGKLQDFTVEEEVRGDFIYWVPQRTEQTVLRSVLAKVTEFQNYLNRTCYLGLKNFETHLTSYPSGTFYKTHKDRFRQNAHRVISFVLYLNPEWKTEMGGELIIYPKGQNSVSIEPKAGRLVVFKSELNHEVKVCHAQRYSMTGWMLDTEPGTTFL